jgi:hypothetical protein
MSLTMNLILRKLISAKLEPVWDPTTGDWV